jgi:hypothetical protein
MELKENNFASDSGHWYTKDGEPAYTVIGKNGKERATTVRDARSMNLIPSVTTILKSCLPAPGLENWKIDQALLSALTLPRLEGETDTDFMARAKYDAKQQSINAMQKGTDVHGAVELHLQGRPYDQRYAPHVVGVMEALKKLAPPSVSESYFIAERSFAGNRYGGKVDVHCPLFVLDLKTKDFSDNLPSIYDEHRYQLAAYAHGLGLHYVDRYIMFVSTRVPGLVHLVKVDVDDKDTDWLVFESMVKTYRLMKGL